MTDDGLTDFERRLLPLWWRWYGCIPEWDLASVGVTVDEFRAWAKANPDTVLPQSHDVWNWLPDQDWMYGGPYVAELGVVAAELAKAGPGAYLCGRTVLELLDRGETWTSVVIATPNHGTPPDWGAEWRFTDKPADDAIYGFPSQRLETAIDDAIAEKYWHPHVILEAIEYGETHFELDYETADRLYDRFFAVFDAESRWSIYDPDADGWVPYRRHMFAVTIRDAITSR